MTLSRQNATGKGREGRKALLFLCVSLHAVFAPSGRRKGTFRARNCIVELSDCMDGLRNWINGLPECMDGLPDCIGDLRNWIDGLPDCTDGIRKVIRAGNGPFGRFPGVAGGVNGST